MPICTKSLDYLEDTRSPDSTTTATVIIADERYAEPCHITSGMMPLNNNDPNNDDNDDQVDEEEEEEEEELAICGDCGRVLGPGWQCKSCRRNCPHCNRALTTDPNDYCGRCFRKCVKHGIIYSLVIGQGCPKCSKSTMTSRPSR